MKEVTAKGKFVNKSLPKHLILNNRNNLDQKAIANSVNEYFVKRWTETNIWNTSIGKIIWDVS